ILYFRRPQIVLTICEAYIALHEGYPGVTCITQVIAVAFRTAGLYYSYIAKCFEVITYLVQECRIAIKHIVALLQYHIFHQLKRGATGVELRRIDNIDLNLSGGILFLLGKTIVCRRKNAKE